MKQNIDALYEELKDRIDQKKLKEITVEIISSYREKDLEGLLRYAALLNIDSAENNLSRLFARVIQQYHPDKLNRIRNEIDAHYRNNALAELVRIRNVYLSPGITRRKVPEYTLDVEETYSYGSDDFGYDERTLYEDEVINDFEFDDLRDELAGEPDDGFIAAVNKLFVGNLDYRLTVGDLNNLEVELDLSDSDIGDLRGIGHCINVTVINLSGNHLYKVHELSSLSRLESLFMADNRIEDIACLSSLENLRELDISFNCIEDISVLRKLGSLSYVNVMENPVKDTRVIEELLARGVIVIY